LFAAGHVAVNVLWLAPWALLAARLGAGRPGEIHSRE